MGFNSGFKGLKSVRREPSCSMRTDRVTRDDGVALRNFANTPKNLTFAVVVYVNKRLNIRAEDGSNKRQWKISRPIFAANSQGVPQHQLVHSFSEVTFLAQPKEWHCSQNTSNANSANREPSAPRKIWRKGMNHRE